jgi:hypothetical protein
MRIDQGEYRITDTGGRRFRPRLGRGSFGRRRFAGLRLVVICSSYAAARYSARPSGALRE